MQSLARPGANITGFSTFEPEIGGKWLELLKEIAPGLKRVAGVSDPAFRGFAGVWRAIETVAPSFGVQVTSVSFHAPTDDLEAAVAAFAREEGGGLIVVPTALNAVHRHRIFLLRHRTGCPPFIPFGFTPLTVA